MSEADEERRWLEADWVVGKTWNRLHHIELSDEDLLDLRDEGSLFEPHTATCGCLLTVVNIPGFFTRMGAPRCQHCCDKVGYPRGIGSPKNDDACRVLLGTKASE